MSERTKKIVIAPAWVAALYEGRSFHNFSVGKVTFEREGVDNRRGYISPRLTESGWENLKNVIESNGHTKYVEYHDEIPVDWRYATQM